MSRCLILIDLQNEFLLSEGNFPIHESSRSFVQNIFPLVRNCRNAGYCVYWIRSEYSNNNPEDVSVDLDSFLSGTHTGRKRCCEKDSYGAQFPAEIADLIKESSTDVVLTKTWYSAFKETTLLSELKQRGVTDLLVGGLITNVCIQATVMDAVAMEFNVNVLEDCLGWRNRASHDKALGKLRELDVQVISSASLSEVTSSTLHPPVFTPLLPTLYYVNGSIPSWRVMMALYEKVRLFAPFSVTYGRTIYRVSNSKPSG